MHEANKLCKLNVITKQGKNYMMQESTDLQKNVNLQNQHFLAKTELNKKEM